jgi:hypothetical protein
VSSAVLFVLALGCAEHVGPPRLLDGALPPAQLGIFYSHQLSVADGRLPFDFHTPSNLPDGIELSTDGEILGFPESTGRFDFVVTVTDDSGLSDSAGLVLGVLGNEGPLAFPEAALPDGFVGDAYEAPLETTGGIPPVAIALREGGLPPGLSLETDAIFGEPITAGRFEFTLEATDAIEESARAALAIDVREHVDLVTERLRPTELGAPYDVVLESREGLPPYAYSVSRGDVPPGIVVTPDGHVTGAGTVDGSFAFTVRADDATGDFDEERYVLHVVDGLVQIEDVDAPIGDACDLPGVLESVPFAATLDVARSGAISELDVYVDVEYADVGYLSLVLTSPDGESVILRSFAGVGGAAGGLETIFDEEDAPAGRLDVFTGDNPLGTWTLTAFVHRVEPGWVEECPGEGRIAAFGLLLRFDGSPDDYLLASGWSPNNLFAEPTARVTGGGLDEDSFTMAIERYTAGANLVREAGKGDDVDLGPLAVTWSTNLRPEQGSINPGTGAFQSGEETGRRSEEVAASGPGLIVADEGGGVSHEYAVRVVAPDWVP